jgi:hypothetical protein
MTESASKASSPFTLVSFLLRFALALLLVLATYNPTAYSFIDWFWVALGDGTLDAIHFFVAVLLVAGWSILIRATFNAMGGFGLTLGVVIFAALIWLLIDLGILSGSGMAYYTWIILVGLAAILTVGLSWSHIWRRLTGQYTVDDVDD